MFLKYHRAIQSLVKVSACTYVIAVIMAVAYYNYLLALREEKKRRMLHRRSIRDASNPFELPQQEFHHIYRVSKEMALYICDEMREPLKPRRSDGLPVYIKVLTCIRFMADGNYQRGTGQDHGLCIAQTTVSKFLLQFCEAMLSRLMQQWIKFPGTAEARQIVSNGFEEKYGVPGVLGTVDCTHVAIFPPPLPHGVQFLNRKGIHTINVQLVADVNCRIIAVNARYPGRVHDQFIFNNSIIKSEMRRLHNERIGEFFLLGDSGYALEPWLMTPILNAAPNSPEEMYTNWHCLVRNIIERTNGYLKGSFRCLGCDRALHYSPDKASKIITCCCIIYNIMKHYRVPVEPESVSEDPTPAQLSIPPQGLLLRVAEERRRNLIDRHFN